MELPAARGRDWHPYPGPTMTRSARVLQGTPAAGKPDGVATPTRANYPTSREILHTGVSVPPSRSSTGMSLSTDTLTSYQCLFGGPEPEFLEMQDMEHGVTLLQQWIAALQSEFDYGLQDICLVYRTNALCADGTRPSGTRTCPHTKFKPRRTPGKPEPFNWRLPTGSRAWSSRRSPSWMPGPATSPSGLP